MTRHTITFDDEQIAHLPAELRVFLLSQAQQALEGPSAPNSATTQHEIRVKSEVKPEEVEALAAGHFDSEGRISGLENQLRQGGKP